MRVLGTGKLNDFCLKHKVASGQAKAWLSEAKAAEWKTPHCIKNRYSNASILHDDIVIFNIKGNHYRLVTKVAYGTQTVLIKWLGTHAAYDKKVW